MVTLTLATAAFAIVFGNAWKANIDINENSFNYNQEEEDIALCCMY